MDRSHMPGRVFVTPEFNAPLIQGAGLNPLRLRDRASAFIEPHDSLVPYHREDSCAERMKKLRDAVVALKSMGDGDYGEGVQDALTEVLALLDSEGKE